MSVSVSRHSANFMPIWFSRFSNSLAILHQFSNWNFDCLRLPFKLDNSTIVCLQKNDFFISLMFWTILSIWIGFTSKLRENWISSSKIVYTSFACIKSSNLIKEIKNGQILLPKFLHLFHLIQTIGHINPNNIIE